MSRRATIARSLSTLLALPLALAACEGTTGPRPPLEALPRPLTSGERSVIGASNDFAFDLFREVHAAGSAANAVVSPLSVSMALGMTMNGAAGDTWSEMRHGLRFGQLTQDEINAAYRGLLDLLDGLDPATRMEVANSIWYARGFPFEESFFRTVRTHFDAEVAGLDFTDSAGTVGRVNDWVGRATNGRIPRILEKVDPWDVMYLINAIYFKGDWRQRFDPARTRDDVFHASDGTDVAVRMMSLEADFRYAWTEGFEVLELPYGNGAFVMTVLRPAEGRSAAELVEGLDQAAWDAALEGLVERRLTVEMPRFRIEYEKVLNDALVALGIERAFVPGGADFSRMSSVAGDRLFVSEVLHKTFIEVDEVGTEAAAATKVTIGLVSLPPAFRLDRPFVFAIRERLSGTILFLGTVERP